MTNPGKQPDIDPVLLLDETIVYAYKNNQKAFCK